MTAEESIEEFIRLGVKAYKRRFRGSIIGRKLDRHEEQNIDGKPISTWKELAVFKMAEYIKEIEPETEVTCYLDGNDSYMEIVADDDELDKINETLTKVIQYVESKI